MLERVPDLDVVAHPRQLEHVAGDAVGRSDEDERGVSGGKRVRELLQQPQSLAVDVLDRAEVDDDLVAAVGRALQAGLAAR